MPCCSLADGLLVVCWPTSYATVWFPIASFERNRRPPGLVEAAISRRSRRSVCFGSARSDSSLRHHRPRHPVAASATYFRYRRRCSSVVSVISRRSYTVWTPRHFPRGTFLSFIVRLLCSVPQGSALGPLLFILHVVDLIKLIEGHGMLLHQDADDAQVGGSCRPSNVGTFSSSVSDCLRDVSSWMKLNRFQLNSSKTEILWCTTSRRQHLPPASALSVDGVMQGWSGDVGAWPWDLHWRWPEHEDPRSAN